MTNDGDLDVFIVQGNILDPDTKAGDTLFLFPWRGSEPPRGRLFRNDLVVAKDGSRVLKFTDVTEKSGIVATGYGMGVAVGDINNDGWPDLYITNLGHNQMYLNKGDGTFVDVTMKTGTDLLRLLIEFDTFDFASSNAPVSVSHTSEPLAMIFRQRILFEAPAPVALGTIR